MRIAELGLRGGSASTWPNVPRHVLGRSCPVEMAQIRRDFPLDPPPEFEAACWARLLPAFESNLKAMPVTAQVLDELRLPRCVATSSSPARVAVSLRVTGLAHRVGSRPFTASEVARDKPAPYLFRTRRRRGRPLHGAALRQSAGQGAGDGERRRLPGAPVRPRMLADWITADVAFPNWPPCPGKGRRDHSRAGACLRDDEAARPERGDRQAFLEPRGGRYPASARTGSPGSSSRRSATPSPRASCPTGWRCSPRFGAATARGRRTRARSSRPTTPNGRR